MMQPTMKVISLTKHFGGVKVFENLSFDLNKNEILGVVGPNGAGKTTLINVLCGAIAANSGEIWLEGKQVNGSLLHEMSKLGVLRSFQQANTFGVKTVRENLLYALTFSGQDLNPDQTAIDLLSQFDLLPRLDEQSNKLAYGLQKVLGMMMIFLARPRVLLLDEPAAGLEVSERPRIDAFIAAAQRAYSTSVLIVEHDMTLIRRLCARMIVLDAGQLIAIGEPQEVLSRKEVLNAYIGETEDQ
ncbi:MAG: ATP-binding cassette domain-containing protein [Alcaligenaceae bacterium]